MKELFKESGVVDIAPLLSLLDPVITEMSNTLEFTQYGFRGVKLPSGDIHYGEGRGGLVLPDRWTEWRPGFEAGTLLNVLSEFDISAIARIRLMKVSPKRCYSWHSDVSIRIHIPLISNKGSFLVIKDESKHLTVGKIWIANTQFPHTAFNGGNSDRFHLVYEYFKPL